MGMYNSNIPNSNIPVLKRSNSRLATKAKETWLEFFDGDFTSFATITIFLCGYTIQKKKYSWSYHFFP